MNPALSVVCGLSFLAILAVVISILLAAKRRKEIAAWALSKGLSFDRARDPGMEARFPAFECLRQGSNRRAYNVSQGEWAHRRFTAFDYYYETYSHNSKGGRQTHPHHFSAIVMGSDVPLKSLFIRPEGFLDKIGEFFGLDDIDFESAEFSRKFYVKAPEKRWAYDVIHARTMEFLLGMPRFTIQFGPADVIVFRSSVFPVDHFESGAEVAQGILDRLPEYVVKQQTNAECKVQNAK